MVYFNEQQDPSQSINKLTDTSCTVVLYIEQQRERILLNFEQRAILGRAMPHEATTDAVYVDLTKFMGFESGVSRRHLMLALDSQNRIVAFDLNSYNGSFLNNKRMSPNTSYTLKTGDQLRLGGLSLEVEVSNTSHKQEGQMAASTPPSNSTRTQHRSTLETPQTRRLELPNPLPDIRNTLQMRPVNTQPETTQNEKGA